MRPSSRSVKIKFAHVAKDGKTLIYDSTSKTWSYVEAPKVEQMTASSGRLQEIDMASATASSTAAAAKVAAETAQSTADSKVTAVEALESARTGMIDVVPINATHERFRSIEFKEDSAGAWTVWINFGDKSLPMTSATRGWLNYATKDDLNDLEDRVFDIEKRLGIK